MSLDIPIGVVRQRQDLVETVLRFLGQKNRGDLVPHSEFAAILGVGPPSPLYYQFMGKVRRKLEDSELALEVVANEGYRLPTAWGQVKLGASNYHKGVKRIHRAGKMIGSSPTAQLTDDQRRIHSAMKDIVDAGAREAKSARLKANRLLAQEAMPRLTYHEDEKKTG